MEGGSNAIVEPSLLVYLFADRLSATTETQLAPLLVATALWGLQRQGLIALEAESRRVLGLWRITELIVYDRSERPTLRDTLPGLERDLLAGIRSARRDSVAGVLRWLIEKKTGNPWELVARIVERDATARGYLEKGAIERTGRAALTRPGVQSLPAAPPRAALDEAFAAFAAEWEAFRTTQPARHRLLLKQCYNAIAARRLPDL